MIQRSSLFLMANLGSEVSKMFGAKERSDMTVLQGASRKAQEIISEIIKYPEMRARIHEIEILSSVITDISSPDPKFKISPKNLKSYFFPFVLRLQLMHTR